MKIFNTIPSVILIALLSAGLGLVLGRLNVLYAFHLFKTGNKDGAVRALAAGLRFSQDVGNGGSLFATLIAKDLLVNHLRAVTGAIHLEQLSANQRSQLQAAVI